MLSRDNKPKFSMIPLLVEQKITTKNKQTKKNP